MCPIQRVKNRDNFHKINGTRSRSFLERYYHVPGPVVSQRDTLCWGLTTGQEVPHLSRQDCPPPQPSPGGFLLAPPLPGNTLGSPRLFFQALNPMLWAYLQVSLRNTGPKTYPKPILQTCECLHEPNSHPMCCMWPNGVMHVSRYKITDTLRTSEGFCNFFLKLNWLTSKSFIDSTICQIPKS